MEKIVNRLISEAVVGADRYTNNGSTWLIFTETRQWVIELTKEKTLWYNYNFFKNLFSYMDFDVVENQDYITKWVEDTIINGVKGTNFSPTFTEYGDWLDGDERLDKIIQNGVKHTPNISLQLVKGYGVANQVENTIKNGVKETKFGAPDNRDYFIKDAIQNGVKETINENHHRLREVVVTLKNGVKYTGGIGNQNWIGNKVKNVIENGIKETLWMNGDSTNWGFEVDGLLEGHDKIEDAINNGIKEVQPLPAQDGNRDWGNYYHGKEDRTKPFNEYLNDVIENGIKI